MRILVVQESDWLRRNPHQQHQMLERLSVRGHDVLVVDYPIQWRDDARGLIAPRRVYRRVAKVCADSNVTVARSATIRVAGVGKLGWLATNGLELGRAFRRFRPDVVINLGLSNGLLALWMARAAGIPVVVHLIDALHALAEPRALRPIAAAVERAILGSADHVVAINTSLAAYARGMGAAPERLSRISTGADIHRFGDHVDPSAIRSELGIDAGDRVLLFSGWLYRFSGLWEIAADMAANPAAWPDVRLLVVGDGDLLPDLQRLRDRHLGRRLILAGRQPPARMPELTAAATLCLFPAHHNATTAHIVPAKLYDYLAAAKPIIASPLPGVRGEFGDDAGIRYAAGPQAVRAVVTELLADDARLAQLGRAARRTAEATGTWDEATDRFLRVLLDTVAATGRPLRRSGNVRNQTEYFPGPPASSRPSASWATGAGKMPPAVSGMRHARPSHHSSLTTHHSWGAP